MTVQTTITDTPVVALVGPTAIGKTALSLQLARGFDCEIVSVDSMQVYRYMDVGTAKIRPEEMEGIPHHLIDVVLPDEDYDAGRFVRDAISAIRSITAKGKLPLLTGGTGLYLKALTEGLFGELPRDNAMRKTLQKRLDQEGSSKLYEELKGCDPESAARIHPQDGFRIIRGLEIYLVSGIPWSSHLRRQQSCRDENVLNNVLQIALTCERELLYDRINYRSEQMIDQGLEEEVRKLLAMGYARELKSMNGIGYRHMINYLDHRYTMNTMLELLRRDTRRYAKRQYTWFRGIAAMEWFDVRDVEGIVQRITEWSTDK